MKCQKCHSTVTRKSKFCPNCGTPVTPRTSQKRSQPQSKMPLGYALALVGLGILAGISILKLSETPTNQSLPRSFDAQSSLAGQGGAVMDIAREFMCPCGTCTDPLDVCDCDHKGGAQEVKGFIAQKLREGHKKPHIMEMVQTEFAAKRRGIPPLLNLDSLESRSGLN